MIVGTFIFMIGRQSNIVGFVYDADGAQNSSLARRVFHHSDK